MVWLHILAGLFPLSVVAVVVLLAKLTASNKRTARLNDVLNEAYDTKAEAEKQNAEMKKQNSDFRKTVHWLTSILDAITIPVSVTNKNMEWTFINKATEQMLGVKRADVFGKKCSNWGANICNTENCGIHRLRNGVPQTSFEQFGGKFNVSALYLYDESGKIDGHVEVVQDITELTRKGAEFEEKAYWCESILDAIPLPLLIMDANSNWIFINKAGERLIGKNRDELIGMPCSDWGVEICDTENCGIACAKRGKAQTSFSQDGKVYQVDVAILNDLRGNVAGYIEVVQEMTIRTP